MSRVLATLINELPSSAALDRITLYAGPRRRSRTARVRTTTGGQQGPPPRVLTGELMGFAAEDHEVTEIVNRLDKLGLFKQIGIDFSGTRSVRERSAREFRISFRVDLEAKYEVVDRVERPRDVLGNEIADVE